LFLFIGGIVLLCRLNHLPMFVSGSLLVFIVFYSYSLSWDIHVGNVTEIQIGMLAFLIFLHHGFMNRVRIVTAGLFGALFVLFKPTLYLLPIGIFCHYFLAKQMRWVLWWGTGILIGTTLAIISVYLTFGGACSWLDWYYVGLPVVNVPHWVARTLIARVFGVTFAMGHMELFIGAQFILFGWMLMVLRSWYQRGGSVQAGSYFVISMSTAIYILSGRLVHAQYFLLVTPLMILSLNGILTEAWTRGPSLFLSVFRSLMALVGIFYVSGKLGFSHDYHNVAYVGTLLLFLHNIWLFSISSPLRYRLLTNDIGLKDC